MALSIETLLGLIKPYLSYLSLTFATWFTYAYTLKCGACSDDIQGLMEYDGKLQGPEYGMIWRWLRFQIVGGKSLSKHKGQDGHYIWHGHVPARYHFLSILVFNITVLLVYTALSQVIGPKLAFLATLLLIVHPCTTQGVAWVSGLAYPLSLLWISLTMILLHWFYLHQTLNNAIWVIPVFCVIQWLSIHAIFATTGMAWALYLFLGYWQFAILGIAISGVMCFDEVRKIVNLRVTEFKKQHMEQSTVMSWRKGIVAMKTLGYYIIHAIFPVRMGLYHTYGFHYDKEIEYADGRFWFGFVSFCFLTWLFFNTTCFPIKLGILWFLIFSTGFWNWITAQQFVTERYIMVASLGLGIIISTMFQNHLAIYFFIVGGYLIRTMMHLPTYDNELRFYQSNVWNFPKSEVALGNLGVTYVRAGLEDTGRDMWRIATALNPDYDVPWVNIFYQYRSKAFMLINHGDYVGGMNKLREALPYLTKALQCKVCHYPEQWKKEHQEILTSLSNPDILLEEELKRLLKCREDYKVLMLKSTDPKRTKEIQESIDSNQIQMDNLVSFFKSQKFISKDPVPFNLYYVNQTLDKLTRRTQ